MFESESECRPIEQHLSKIANFFKKQFLKNIILFYERAILIAGTSSFSFSFITFISQD